MMRHIIHCLAASFLLTISAQSSVMAVDAKIDFNLDIRPVLAKHCFSCHGQDEKKREGGLRLDREDSATVPAESDAVAVVPGNVENSEMYQRIISADEDLRMPPVDSGGALAKEEIDLIARWIKQGAPFAEHWSFAPPVRAALPAVQDKAWPKNEIDHFVLARLEKAGLKPSPRADRHTLIRRVSLDLRGLPPTLAEVDSFVNDKSPKAYEDLVDRMLADKAYGERWARVWLDLARYADSMGYGSDPLRTIWPYRDWVIDALNANMPYDQFTIEQLAGDLLPNATLQQKIATAMHRNTMTNTEGGTDDEEFRVAAVKDRIDTTVQVWMGLTMGCAKCHSHKYDPITHQEYYQFFAIFNQTADADRPDESPLLAAPTPEYLASVKKIDDQIAPLKAKLEKLRKEAAAAPAINGRFVRIDLPGEGKILSLAEVQVFQGKENLAQKGKASQSSVGSDGPPELGINGITEGDYYKSKTTHTQTEANPWWEVDLGKTITISQIVVWNRTDNNLQSRLAGYRVSVLDEQRKTVWSGEPTSVPNPSSEFPPSPDAAVQQQITKLEQSKPKPPTTPVMVELTGDKRRVSRMMIKGDFLNPGEEVKQAVPAYFHPLPKDAPNNRLGAAMWLVDRKNPLTARVLANRFWAQLFNSGIVETEEDFGTQGELPSHPQLLDHLAVDFMEFDWDMKALLKKIVSSAAYQQSSVMLPIHLEKDPRNRLISRGPRHRLEAEMIRDQALAISGLLSRKMHGPSVYPPQPAGLWRAAFNGKDRKWATSTGEDRYRRGLYTFWRRTTPYPSLAAFDAPSREICSVRRITTNTPLQAFVTMNDPVYVEAAQALGRRIVREGGDKLEDRARFALRLCLVRPAQEEQVKYLVELYQSELEYYKNDAEAAQLMATEPLGQLPEGMQAVEMAAWTVISNVLLNTDAVLTKG